MTYKKLYRPLFMVLGLLSLLTGIIGIVLPLLPTTPFLILASFFFARSSPRFHRWIHQHKIFGPPVRHWELYGAIHRRAKIVSTLLILLGAVFPLGIIPLSILIKITVVLIFLSVLLFIWTRPEAPNVELKAEQKNQ